MYGVVTSRVAIATTVSIPHAYLPTHSDLFRLVLQRGLGRVDITGAVKTMRYGTPGLCMPSLSPPCREFALSHTLLLRLFVRLFCHMAPLIDTAEDNTAWLGRLGTADC